MYKKVKTGISILVTALLIASPLLAYTQASPTADETKNEEEDLPDLTITSMWLEGNDRSCAYIGKVKNIGEATFHGYAKVKIKATINMVLHRERTTLVGRAEGLEPRDSVQIWAMQFRHPKVLIHFDIEVNPDHKFNESNYENNDYQETFLAYDKQGVSIEERNKEKNNQFFNLFQNPDTNSFLNNMFNNQPLFNSFQSNQKNQNFFHQVFSNFNLQKNNFFSNPIKNVFQNMPTNDQQSTETEQNQQNNTASEQQKNSTNDLLL